MRFDVLVIGGGMAGTVAASKAADSGREVAVVRRGYGATALSSGAIDVALDPLRISNDSWSDSSSIKRGLQELIRRNPHHPYRTIAYDTDEPAETVIGILREALDESPISKKDGNFHWNGSLDTNQVLANNLGTYKFAAFSQGTISPGDLLKLRQARLLFIGIQGLSCFDPRYLADSLLGFSREHGKDYVQNTDFILLNFPGYSRISNILPAELAAGLDDPEIANRFMESVKQAVVSRDCTHLVLPPVCGLGRSSQILAGIQNGLGYPCFETLSAPISVPGLRLQRALDEHLTGKGIRVLDGEVVTFKKSGAKIDEVRLKGEGIIAAKSFVLATGKYIGGGVVKGQGFREPIFDLPLFFNDERIGEIFIKELLERNPEASHPAFSVGLKTDSLLRPLQEESEVIHENLFAAGAVLGGYNYLTEKCGLGVALATGLVAGKNAGEL